MATGATLATADQVLKVFYLPPVQEVLTYPNVLVSQLDTDTQIIEGKNFTVPLHTGRNEGVGAAGENEDLPDAGAQVWDDMIVPARYEYGTAQFTGQSLKATRSNRGSFIRVMDKELNGLRRDLKRDLNRQLWGDGSGALTTVDGAEATPSVTFTVDATTWLRANMHIDIWKSDLTAKEASDVIVSSLVASTKVVTLTSAITCTDGAIVTRKGVKHPTTGAGREVMGITGIIDSTGALQGLNPATTGEEFWAATEKAVGGSLSELAMDHLVDDVVAASDLDVDMIVCSRGVRRSFRDLFIDRQRFPTLNLAGNYKALDYDGMILATDTDATAETMFFLNTSMFQMYDMGPWDFMDDDGHILARVPNRDAYNARVFRYLQLACRHRAASGKLTGITELGV